MTIFMKSKDVGIVRPEEMTFRAGSTMGVSNNLRYLGRLGRQKADIRLTSRCTRDLRSAGRSWTAGPLNM